MAYGVLLHMQGKGALVVGGGKAALGKVRTLLNEGARVRVVSMEFLMEFETMVADEEKSLELIQGAFQEEHLEDVDLVITATSSDEVNREVLEASRRRHLWCNNAADSTCSDMQNMAHEEKGGVHFFASSLGGTPGLTGKLLRDLVESLDAKDLEALQRYADFRKLVRRECEDSEVRKYWLQTLMNTPASQLDQWFDGYRKGEGYDRQGRK